MPLTLTTQPLQGNNMYKLLPLLLGTLLFAQSNSDKIEAMQQSVIKLQKEIQSLKKVQNEDLEQNKNDFDELYDFTENVETKVLEDKLKFGLWLKFGDDCIEKKYTNNEKVNNSNLLTTKLMLNLKADVTKSIKFYGRLSMYKYWGSSAVHPYSYYDNMQGRVPSDSGLYVERAYMDWFFLQDSILPMALTIGRQPSTDGPSHQFKDNVSRKATYSALLYDGVADGAVVTFNLSKLFSYSKTYLRFGYSKGFGYVNSETMTGNAFIGASNSDIQDTNVYGVFFDTTFFNIPNSLVQVSFSKMKDIIANPLDTNYSNNDNIGDMDLAGVAIELSNINNLNLDLFAHYGYNKSHPNNNRYTIATPNGEFKLGLLGEGDTINSQSGSSLWVGGRYGLGGKQQYKVGFEYNHGSRHWVSLTQGGYDLYNKLSTRGDAYEGYLMYVHNRNLNFRLGYLAIDYKYNGSGWFVGAGESVSSDSTTKKLDTLAAVYLKMNLVF